MIMPKCTVIMAGYLNASTGHNSLVSVGCTVKEHFTIKVTVNRELAILLTNLSIDANSLNSIPQC